jgi:hypothetical protein
MTVSELSELSEAVLSLSWFALPELELELELSPQKLLQKLPQPPQPPQRHPPTAEPIPGFLRQLIPKGFDTGDLIIVLLLLLIAGDSQESRSNALLTLALYFIL